MRIGILYEYTHMGYPIRVWTKCAYGIYSHTNYQFSITWTHANSITEGENELQVLSICVRVRMKTYGLPIRYWAKSNHYNMWNSSWIINCLPNHKKILKVPSFFNPTSSIYSSRTLSCMQIVCIICGLYLYGSMCGGLITSKHIACLQTNQLLACKCDRDL